MQRRDQHHAGAQQPRYRFRDRPPLRVDACEVVEARHLRVTSHQRLDVDVPLLGWRIRSAEDLEAFERDLAAVAPVGLHRGDHDIRAALPPPVRLVEHRDCRPATARVAEIDAQARAARRCVQRAKQHLGVRSLVLASGTSRLRVRRGPRDDVDAHVGQFGDQPVDEAAMEPAAHALVRCLADDDVLHRQFLRDG